MRMKFWLMAGAAIALSSANAHASSVVFTSGPTNGTVDAYNIAIYAEAAPFTLSGATTITGFQFGGWTLPGTAITSVSYGFSPALDFSTPSSATLTAGTVNPASFGYEVRDYTASIAPVTLAAGTYYFNLFNAQGAGTQTYWDVNNTSPTAYYSFGGTSAPTPVGSNLAFTLFGTPSAVPEPSTWAMMLLGFGMMGFAMRSRAKVRSQKVTFNFA